MIQVIDVFAGPGGLNEGFSAFRRKGKPVFDVAASFEMESNAVATLHFRAGVRRLMEDARDRRAYFSALSGTTSMDAFRALPDVAAALKESHDHVHQLELGPKNRETVAQAIREALSAEGDFVLIGGPPCQAYSLVGRSRRTNDPLFQEDHKHFLYREYLDILKRFRPAVFVMENVKGLLSAGHGGVPMFTRIIEDLRQDGLYRIQSLAVRGDDLRPSDYVLRAERFGIPQRRHRVILLGIRSDVEASFTAIQPRAVTTVRDAISELPHVRAGASRAADPSLALARAAALGSSLARRDASAGDPQDALPWTETDMDGANVASNEQHVRSLNELRQWLSGDHAPISLHEPRRHMEGDLARYRYLAEMARAGVAPKVTELPRELRPAHRNLSGPHTPFVDRFKVQRWDEPSSTVASHISKDGHYYIHPDPEQMRSLTVREAARLQTFPDNYYFCGPRTAQYHQVGNAVPPLLALRIAEKVAEILGA